VIINYRKEFAVTVALLLLILLLVLIRLRSPCLIKQYAMKTCGASLDVAPRILELFNCIVVCGQLDAQDSSPAR
jgi:hypothetical protein